MMDHMGLEANCTRRRLAAILALALATGWLPHNTRAELPPRYRVADLKALQHAFVELADTVRPSVVAIRTYRVRDPHDPGSRLVMRPHSQGSGFIIDSDGYIATNRHVIADADVISILLDNGLKHTSRGSTVVITCTDSLKEFTVSISDDGPGMADLAAGNVRPINSLPVVVKDPSESTALIAPGTGLRFVSEVATMHGGSSMIELNERGGTTVTLKFLKHNIA